MSSTYRVFNQGTLVSLRQHWPATSICPHKQVYPPRWGCSLTLDGTSLATSPGLTFASQVTRDWAFWGCGLVGPNRESCDSTSWGMLGGQKLGEKGRRGQSSWGLVQGLKEGMANHSSLSDVPIHGSPYLLPCSPHPLQLEFLSSGKPIHPQLKEAGLCGHDLGLFMSL